jgi:NADP-dependent 3-hydroxy acid dehydrogenase YdfG
MSHLLQIPHPLTLEPAPQVGDNRGMNSVLKDKVVLVTGAGSGIGAAIARHLAAAGCELALVGRTASSLEAVARGIQRASVFVGDVGDEQSVRTIARQVLGQYGRVDVLIHNAGAYAAAPVETATLADFDHQWNVNLRGPFLLTQLLLPSIKQSRGQIVFINSSAGARSHANVSQYAATKFGLKALADALREEVSAHEVRVISVFPGRTATPMQERVMRGEGRPYLPEKLLQADDVASAVVHALSLPPTAEITDLHIRPARKHP